MNLDDFNHWYAGHRLEFLEPAKTSATKALSELLDRELTEPERVRVQVRPGRVKSASRAWMKLVNKYPEACTEPEQIPDVMDDLVGVKIVCTNHSDLRKVKAILEDLPTAVPGEIPVLATEPDSVRDYYLNPKPSGYRAWHVNILTTVSRATERHPVRCELQLRTLLQDGWGELTHEDTYKPDTAAPPLVMLLSQRMAALMLTLDDIAQDLRDEMDRIAYDSAQEQDEPEAPKPIAVSAPLPRDGRAREAGIEFLQERLRDIDQPLDLASLAWELQREFGQEIVRDWLGSGTFKRLVQDSVPELTISSRAPSYVLPKGFNAKQMPAQAGTSAAPRAAQLLHESDKSFPLLTRELWSSTYRALSWGTHQIAWLDAPDLRVQRELTHVSRGSQVATSANVRRRWLDYVAHTLLLAHSLTPAMSAEKIEYAFREWTVARAIPFGLTAQEITELSDWLSLETQPEVKSLAS